MASEGLQRLRMGSICGQRAAGVARVILWATLVLVWLDLQTYAAGSALDDGWRQGYSILYLRGARAGVDYQFTFGPLGFLYGGNYEPSLFVPRLVWGLAYSVVAATVMVASLLRVEGLARKALFAAVLVLVPSLNDGQVLVVALAGASLCGGRKRPSPLLVVFGLLLAVLAMIKFTYLVIAGATAAAIAGSLLSRGRGWAAGAWLVGVGGAYAALWGAAGQSWADWPAYIASSIEISRGYSAGMVIVGRSDLTVIGACSTLLFAVAAVLRQWFGRLGWAGAPTTLLCLVLGFVAWKHGFVRQDGHMIGCFGFLSVAPFLLWRRPGRLPPRARRALALSVALSVGGALAGMHLFRQRESESGVVAWPGMALDRAVARCSDLSDLGGLRARLEAERDRLRVEHELPRIREAVGAEGIDCLSVSQGLLFLNGLRWQNRPVIQGYEAYTPALAQRNADFLASPHAPQYLLLDGVAIDGHVPTHDDGLALLAAIRRYELALVEQGLPLLRKRSRALAGGEQVFSGQVPLGAPIRLGPLGPGPKAVAIDVRSSALGEAWTSGFRGAEVGLRVEFADGRQQTYWIVPGTARAGFLIDPLPRNAVELGRFFAGGEVLRVVSIAVVVRAGRRWWFESSAGVRVWTVPRPPAPALDSETEEELFHTRALGVRALLLDSPHLGACEVPGVGPALQVHAPGRVVVRVPSGAARLTGVFGLHPGSYTGEGRTDGARFTIEAGGETLWKEVLLPLSMGVHQGPQELNLVVPGGIERLELRTGVGRRGEWDWCYWAGLRFLDARGRLVPSR